MATKVHDPESRTHAKRFRADSQAVRSDSRMARMRVNQSVSRAAVREAMARTGTTPKQFVDRANTVSACHASTFSESLNGQGRNLETDWILAQDEAFILAFWESVKHQMQLTPESRQAARAERIAELVRLIVEVA
jgi:hypothetical protein